MKDNFFSFENFSFIQREYYIRLTDVEQFSALHPEYIQLELQRIEDGSYCIKEMVVRAR